MAAYLEQEKIEPQPLVLTQLEELPGMLEQEQVETIMLLDAALQTAIPKR